LFRLHGVVSERERERERLSGRHVHISRTINLCTAGTQSLHGAHTHTHTHLI